MSEPVKNHNLIALNNVYQALIELNLLINENVGSEDKAHRNRTLREVQHRITDSILSVMTAMNIEKVEGLGAFFEIQNHK